jgi:DNA mismatch endonuclease (patch repair protein)
MPPRTPRLTPSFDGFRPSSVEASRIKKANRSRDTLHEVELQDALKSLGLDFERHREDLPGKPDIVFPLNRVAVFCDGDFWHGRNWPTLRRALQRRANPSYWIAKIRANRQRDVRCRRALMRLGWLVVSLWETDIRRNPESAALTLKELIRGSGTPSKNSGDASSSSSSANTSR